MIALGVITLGVITLGAITLGVITLGVIALGVITLGVITLGVITLQPPDLGLIYRITASVTVYNPYISLLKLNYLAFT